MSIIEPKLLLRLADTTPHAEIRPRNSLLALCSFNEIAGNRRSWNGGNGRCRSSGSTRRRHFAGPRDIISAVWILRQILAPFAEIHALDRARTAAKHKDRKRQSREHANSRHHHTPRR